MDGGHPAAADGQGTPLTGGRGLTIKIDSQLTPGVRMSMVIDVAYRSHRREGPCSAL